MSLSSFGQYTLLVLLPQALWVLLGSNQGLPLLLCEGCSLFPSQYLLHKAAPGVPPTPSQCLGSGRADNWTSRLCSCDIHKQDLDDHNRLDLLNDDGLGGWGMAHCLPDLSGPCTIERRGPSLTLMQFLNEFAYREPVILTGMSSQEAFRTRASKYQLLRDYGQEMITVATANTHSYRKVQMTLCDYVENVMRPQSYHDLGNETLYHFGDNDRERWDGLFSLYQLPSLSLPGKMPVLSFGLAGPGSGVPFHIHGPTYAETIYGRKRWFLYPPPHAPLYNPDETTLHWVTHTYPSLPDADRPLECTLHPDPVSTRQMVALNT